MHFDHLFMLLKLLIGISALHISSLNKKFYNNIFMKNDENMEKYIREIEREQERLGTPSLGSVIVAVKIKKKKRNSYLA